jgi:ABC-type transport system substrate-binding protein
MAATLRYSATLLLCALTTGCGGGGAAAGPAGGTVVYGMPSDLETFNPLVADDAFAQQVHTYLLYTPLLRRDSTLQPAPLPTPRERRCGDRGPGCR